MNAHRPKDQSDRFDFQDGAHKRYAFYRNSTSLTMKDPSEKEQADNEFAEYMWMAEEDPEEMEKRV